MLIRLQEDKAFKLIEAFRSLDSEIPSQTISVFLVVANNENISMSDLAAVAGISQASCSRNVSYLGEINRRHEPGFGLLRATPDPQERRRNLVTLTPKGRKFYEKILKILE